MVDIILCSVSNLLVFMVFDWFMVVEIFLFWWFLVKIGKLKLILIDKKLVWFVFVGVLLWKV